MPGGVPQTNDPNKPSNQKWFGPGGILAGAAGVQTTPAGAAPGGNQGQPPGAGTPPAGGTPPSGSPPAGGAAPAPSGPLFPTVPTGEPTPGQNDPGPGNMGGKPFDDINPAQPDNPVGLTDIPGLLTGGSNEITKLLQGAGQFYGWDPRSNLNLAFNLLYPMAMERENRLDFGESLLSNAVGQQVNGPGAQVLQQLMRSLLTQPYIASDPALKAGMRGEATRRYAAAGQAAGAQMTDRLGAAGMGGGGEARALKAGAGYRASTGLADALNSIEQEFALRQAQERQQNIAGAGSLMQTSTDSILNPQAVLAQAYANRVNPERQAMVNELLLKANSGGSGGGFNVGNLLTGGGSLLGGLGALIAASDERVKTDILDTRISIDGVPVKVFRYKGRPERHIGVMAQDTEKVHPEAVFTRGDGMKFVDYGRLLAGAA